MHAGTDQDVHAADVRLGLHRAPEGRGQYALRMLVGQGPDSATSSSSSASPRDRTCGTRCTSAPSARRPSITAMAVVAVLGEQVELVLARVAAVPQEARDVDPTRGRSVPGRP